MTLENNLNNYLQNIWNDYILLNPPATKIHELLKKRGENIINDHIAFRTFAHPQFSAKRMADFFTRYGYNIENQYEFPEKKLKALHLQHFDVAKPKIFISEIDINQLTEGAQKILRKAISQIPETTTNRDDLPFSGRHWQASLADYNTLKSETEYAAWLYAHGFRPNHFTISANELKYLNDISSLNSYLKSHGFKLNAAGGEVKGSPLVYLEQSSTLASPVKVSFKEGIFAIPGGYYEFAKRYPLENNKLFQGFIAESADKIFESTNQF